MAESNAGEASHAVGPVDLGQLAMLSDGDVEFERVLIDSFIQSVGESVGLLETHMEDRDWENCRRDAHKIKGASATLGAPKLRQIAMELEDHFRDGAVDQVVPLALALREEYEKVRACLQRRIDGEQ